MFDWIRKLFGNRFKTGTEVVNDVISQFTDTVDTLRSAIDEIDGDICDNQIDIQALKTENTELGNSKVQALGLIRGLKELLGN